GLKFRASDFFRHSNFVIRHLIASGGVLVLDSVLVLVGIVGARVGVSRRERIGWRLVGLLVVGGFHFFLYQFLACQMQLVEAVGRDHVIPVAEAGIQLVDRLLAGGDFLFVRLEIRFVFFESGLVILLELLG